MMESARRFLLHQPKLAEIVIVGSGLISTNPDALFYSSAPLPKWEIAGPYKPKSIAEANISGNGKARLVAHHPSRKILLMRWLVAVNRCTTASINQRTCELPVSTSPFAALPKLNSASGRSKRDYWPDRRSPPC
jgi:hypothetical protein